MSIATMLADFATGPVARDAKMERFVRFSLLDWASVGVAGRGEPVARAARAVALGESGSGATLFGGGQAAPRAAALANGAASHALDYDDTHFGHIGHPSVAVIPATLALAEARGGDIAEALTVGLETACRVGAWLGRSHYDAGFHQTGTSGAFGATAAAVRLLGLERARATHAFALTATRAGGLKSQFGTMGKPLNAGLAAEAGVTCALLAEAGADGAAQGIEGAQGFGPTHAGEARDAAWRGMGEAWLFPGISYKFHACCHGLHAMLEALREAPREGVEAVTVVTNPRWLAVCNQPAPTTGLGAKFSYRLAAAMALSGIDTAALESYSAETCAREDVVALRDRVVVETDAGLSDTQARVAVRAGGGVYEATHDLLDPIDPAVLGARLEAKSVALIGDGSAADLSRAVEAMDLPALIRIVGTP